MQFLVQVDSELLVINQNFVLSATEGFDDLLQIKLLHFWVYNLNDVIKLKFCNEAVSIAIDLPNLLKYLS